ncbi:Coenzyme F420 hydrogenase/dehydrogenase, beta subunit C-terminal domain [Mycolicibacterium litorale]|uniref:Coenzyme F420 hydrogenase/dehydrogenase, beta subunit C-terminal domain n=1 Tax=Mycolicibacterium litorale TaxID=758802 RepID=UPI003CF6F7D5
MSASGKDTGDTFKLAVGKVVDNQNCTGCGACALISSRVVMTLSADGYSRPTVAQGPDSKAETKQFQKVCPGVRVDARDLRAPHSHETFGKYWSVWEAWALDPAVRHKGSSAGVITALAQGIVTSGGRAVGATASAEQPSQTVPITLTTKEEALSAAGSRYAPVATASRAKGLTNQDAFIGKPCEASAVRAYQLQADTREEPLLLSFFCAGTPSQLATDELANGRLGIASDDIERLQYRGNGWPGEFEVVTRDGESRSLSYQESWGQVLGKALQWRCKICPDGTGQLADVTVGDFWEADSNGYPRFDTESVGRSVVICRTKRGHEAVLRAAQDSVIQIRELDIEQLVPVQPLQVDRRSTMAGRIIGTAAAGRAVPRFRGFGVVGLGFKYADRNLRAGVGAYLRVLGRRA